jgi:hypothetical protein
MMNKHNAVAKIIYMIDEENHKGQEAAYKYVITGCKDKQLYDEVMMRHHITQGMERALKEVNDVG